MKRDNNFSSLLGHLSQAKTNRRITVGTPLPTDLARSHVTQPSAHVLKPGSSTDAKAVSFEGVSKQIGLHFGAVRSNSGTTPGATGQWASLLSKTASGGLASAFGGNLLSVVGGLGGLVSGIAGLFGGSKETLPALTPFQLPNSQTYVAQVSQNTSRSESGLPMSSDGVYGSNLHASSSTHNNNQSPNYAYQSQQIAQAVKEALLNSSSLNDVIAEI